MFDFFGCCNSSEDKKNEIFFTNNNHAINTNPTQSKTPNFKEKENRDIVDFINEPLSKLTQENIKKKCLSNNIDKIEDRKETIEKLCDQSPQVTIKDIAVKSRIISKIKISEKEVNENKILLLKEVEGIFLEEDVKINARGRIDSNYDDGITYFGRDLIMNDVIMKTQVDSPEESLIYFSVIFNSTYKRYFLRNDSIENEFESNIFIQVKFYHVTEKNIFIVGDYQFSLEVIKEQTLKIDYGYINKNVNSKIFTKDKKKVIIGRKRDCDIILDDASYLRNQFVIEFEKNGWSVKELEHNQFGLWMYLDKKNQFEISNKIKFKFRNSVFVIEFMN